LCIFRLDDKLRVFESDGDVWSIHIKPTWLFKSNINFNKPSSLSNDTLVENVQKNLFYKRSIGVDEFWDILINLKCNIHILLLHILIANIYEFVHACSNLYLRNLSIKLILRNIINLLEIFDFILHFLDFIERVVDDCFAFVLNIEIKIFKSSFGLFCVLVDLIHKVVSHLTHLLLSFHNLFIHNNRSNISDNQKLISPTCNFNINLIKCNIFWDFWKVINWTIIIWLNFRQKLKDRAFFIVH
jgi:hypothetical protein